MKFNFPKPKKLLTTEGDRSASRIRKAFSKLGHSVSKEADKIVMTKKNTNKKTKLTISKRSVVSKKSI